MPVGIHGSGVATIAYAYDDLARSVTTTQATDGGALVTRTVVDGLGRPTRIESPVGDVTTMTYENAGRVVTTRTTSPGGDSQVQRTWATSWGAPYRVEILEPTEATAGPALAHLASEHSYDRFGRAIGSVSATGAASSVTYNAFGAPATMATLHDGDPDRGEVVEFVYDVAGRLQRRISRARRGATWVPAETSYQ